MDVDETAAVVVDAAVAIHRATGPGLLESAYEAMMEYELVKRGLKVQRQFYAPLTYHNLVVERAFCIDLLVNDDVIVELKSAESIAAVHIKQVLTYLRMMKLHTALLLNFGQTTLKAGGIRRIMNGYEPHKKY